MSKATYTQPEPSSDVGDFANAAHRLAEITMQTEKAKQTRI
ncbi:hypothetical protein SAMN05216328_13310 [Ensifer sp. YR511]|nr:hypothetical protein [Ensifer sp. PDNC004]SDN67610.1 hypothetical protein SAMN05216328_13310 [Ensifer sp. YR511]